MRRWAAAAAIIGGLTWIPVRAAISVTFDDPLLGLTYVEWNRIEVIPIGLMLLTLTLCVSRMVRGRLATAGLWVAAIGLAGMLIGVIVEFWIAGGVLADRELSVTGWLIYLLPGIATHLVGMLLLGFGLLRQGGRPARTLGYLAVGIGVLHALWIPSGFVAPLLLLTDQTCIGLAWVGIGLALLEADAPEPLETA